MYLLYSFLVIFSLYISCAAEIPLSRFEYKYSFKPPYLAQYDGSIPFWKYGGNAIASTDNVRVAPSLKSQKGAIWTKQATTFEWWHVDFTFRITGRGRIGADGLAFWYTDQPGDFDGPVFGSSDKWNGLGVFFDSFDNDNKHNNPYIMAVVNDGTKNFDHSNDGSSQMSAGCLRDFRNKPFSTRAKIEYYKNILTVLFHNGNTNNENDFEVCLRVENVMLPKYGHFGISAATGGLADDHDVKQLLTHSLHPPGTAVPVGTDAPAADKQKLSDEYAEYQRKLELQKEQYKKEHPDSHKEENEYDEWFESDNQRELRQIFSVQTQMHEAIRILSNKLDEVIGRQERTLSLLSQSGFKSSAPVGNVGDSIASHDMENIVGTQKNIHNTAIEIRNFVLEAHRKIESILQNQIKQPTAQVQSVNYDTSRLVSEIQEGVNSVKKDLNAVVHRLGSSTAGSCPNVSCVTNSMFFVYILIHVLVLVGYFIYRDSREAQAKKFY